MKSVHKERVNVYLPFFRMAITALNRHRIAQRILNALLDMFAKPVNVPVDVDMTIIVPRMMPVSIVSAKIHVSLPTHVDRMHSVPHSSTGHDANVPKTILEIHMSNVTPFLMTIVKLTLLVHLERFVNQTDVSPAAEMTSIASSMKRASTNSVKIHVPSTALVDQMLSANLSTTTDNVHVFLTILEMQKLIVTESDLLQNVLSINNVRLVPSVRMKLAFLDADTLRTVPPNNLVLRTNVSMHAPFLALVELVQPVLLPIILPSATAHLDSEVTRTLNVGKFHLNVDSMMNVGWKRFVSSTNVSLDAELTPTVPSIGPV